MNNFIINRELEFISDYLQENIQQVKCVEGLFTGYLGTLIFFVEYNKRKNLFDELINDLTANLINDIRSSKVDNLDLASGLSGYLFTLFFLEKNDYLESGATRKLFESLKPTFVKVIKAKIANGDFDFLYGYIGILHVCNKIDKQFVEEYEFIELILEDPKAKLPWRYNKEDNNQKLQNKRIDYGFAHGVPSIISFLLKCYESNGGQQLKEELCLAAEYLGSIISLDGLSYFTYSSFSNDSTRLAWCYGDLPNAILLARLCHSLELKSSGKMSEKILNTIITERCSVEKNGVLDNCLCHGSLGISFQFNYYQKLFNINTFQNGAKHWLDIAINYQFNTGNKYFPHSDVTSGPLYDTEKHSMLEGITGCGLAYLSLCNNKRLLWEDLLMIN
ncbi:lanthionine synthetase LanC family protein [Marivirga arenosa]|uniref:Lanthionine synthetase LanC family protein n=1 Tax=Marivirga arenosa TaxID=3059076 RepID=A0AA49JCU6_9BACT|nr:lanthionine synthetase LanC family protein [Marivirga sp. BKB1-2]WKK81752.2 lanthionine synthetase LanC family protein [Marivirga sp. BKB1-2]